MVRYRQMEVSFGPPLNPVVKHLIIFTTAAFVASFVLESWGWVNVTRWLGLTPYLVTHGFFLWQPVTYLFLHAGFWHIVFNMFALWMFGSELAGRWGARQFLFYYLLTGVGAAAFDVLVHPSARTTTIGCSGAIYGILLAYGLYFGERIILFAFILPMKAKWMVAIFGGIEFLSAVRGGPSPVSHIAHLGGMLVGLIYLRGGSIPYRWQLRYHEWQRARLRRKFETYMRKQDGKDESGRWIN
jgi:membrane associated rhomboid family serine protease